MSLGLEEGLVKLVPHDNSWEDIFNIEKENISKNVSNLLEIEHCGSTSIPNIVSKPIMNICIAIDSSIDIGELKKEFENIGYEYKPTEFPDHELFIKKEGKLVTTHVHVMSIEGINWKKAILFRDHLLNNPDVSREYEELKKGLAEKFPDDRKSYAEGKNPFINQVLEKLL